jgi:hypothetical protein
MPFPCPHAAHICIPRCPPYPIQAKTLSQNPDPSLEKRKKKTPIEIHIKKEDPKKKQKSKVKTGKKERSMPRPSTPMA